MSYAHVVTTDHRDSDGYWCADCIPAADTSACGYCNCTDDPMTCLDVAEDTDAHDRPEWCKDCGVLLDNELTTDGESWVRDQLDSDLTADTPEWLATLAEIAERWPDLFWTEDDTDEFTHAYAVDLIDIEGRMETWEGQDTDERTDWEEGSGGDREACYAAAWQTPGKGWGLDAFTDDDTTDGQGFPRESSRAQVARTALDFIEANMVTLAMAKNTYSPAFLGSDLALTSHHHGVGYWDRGLGVVGERLTEASHGYAFNMVWCHHDDDPASDNSMHVD